MKKLRACILILVLFSIVAYPQAQNAPEYKIFLPMIGGTMTGFWQIIVPVATENIEDNPSFETNTTGWLTGGINAIARSNVQQKFGLYSLLITYQNDLALAHSNVTLTVAEYQGSVWVFIPGAYDGARIEVQFSNFVGAATTNGLADMTITDAWQRVTATITPVGGDLVGQIAIVGTGAAPTAGRTVYIDAVQVEQQSQVTTYCDGGQKGCEWNGAAHASTSTRSGLSRAGGFVYDLADQYGFNITEMIDAGMPPVSNITDTYALAAGGQVQGVKVHERSFTLMGKFFGTSLPNLNALRQALINVTKPDAVPETDDGPQPFLLRYTPTGREIAVHYESGLEARINGRFVCSELIPLRVFADDPYFYEIGNSAAVLDTTDFLATRYLAGRERRTGQWGGLGLGANPTLNGIVYAIVHNPVNGLIYFGGDFEGLGGVAGRDYIAAYNPFDSTWSTVGPGGSVSNEIHAIAIAPNGDVYAGGLFNALGGAGGDRVAYFDISAGAWSIVAAGGGGTVFALAFGVDGTLYIGGNFVNWNAVGTSDYIVQWDGAAYSSMTTGCDNDVDEIEIAADGGVWCVGNFTTAGGLASRGVAEWDGTAWIVRNAGGLGGGGASAIDSMAIAVNGYVYVAGRFTSIDGVTADNIAFFNGASWDVFGGGLNNQARRLAFDSRGNLYISGGFTMAGDLVLVDGLVIWNGSSWIHLDIDLPGNPGIWQITPTRPHPVTNLIHDVYIGFDSTAVSAFSGSAIVDNEGTEHARPVFHIVGGTAPQVIKQIRNETTGRTLSINYAPQDGEEIVIDIENLSVTSSFSGNIPGAMLSGTDFGIFDFLSGNNQITVFVNVTGGGTNPTAWAEYRDTYWSMD